RAEGKPLAAAVVEAARLRLRPILMTSFAFIMGVLPMAISTGAGANARNAIGTGVIGGMLAATFLGLLMIPVFYVVVRRLLGDRMDEPPPAPAGDWSRNGRRPAGSRARAPPPQGAVPAFRPKAGRCRARVPRRR